MTLLDLPAFSTAAATLREAALKLRTVSSSVTIAAPLDENGVFASALLEAALLDSGIPFQRRLRENPEPAKGPSIVIGSSTVSQMRAVESDPLCLYLDPLEVDALVASGGDVRRGVLSPVALAAALGSSITKTGSISRLLMPWILTGNWLSEGLEHTYDPVYTVLRDILRKGATFGLFQCQRCPMSIQIVCPELMLWLWEQFVIAGANSILRAELNHCPTYSNHC